MLKYVGLLMLIMMCLVAPATASASTPAKYEALYDIVSNQEKMTVIDEVTAFSAADQREVMCLALNIYHEARGSSARDQWAVGFVTMNRWKNGYWGRNLCDVVWISNLVRGKRTAQFTWTLRPVTAMIPREATPWQNAQRKAAVLYSGEKSDFTNGATHFYLAKLNPGWARRGLGKIRIGEHIYMRVPTPRA